MSIDRDRFEEASEADLGDLSTTDRVLGFLAVNDDKAFEAGEIASRTGLESSAVSTALTRLKDRNLVEHKATYWAITDDEGRRRAYDGYERATALYNDQLGAEDPDAWADHAPEDPHPNSEDERE